MVGLPRQSASCSSLFLLAMCRGWGRFIVTIVTQIQNHFWNVVRRGRDVNACNVCRVFHNNHDNGNSTILVRKLPASLSEKVRGLKTVLSKGDSPQGWLL